MVKPARWGLQAHGPGQGQLGSTSTDPDLDRLSQRFAEFHRAHPPMTRIPLALREAVVAAIQRGVPRAQLRRACGVSPSQLDRWQKRHGERAHGMAPGRAAPRVFAVVPEAPAEGAKPADRRAVAELELRLGGWSIRVRPDDA